MGELSKLLNAAGIIFGVIVLIFAIPAFGIGTVLLGLVMLAGIGFVGSKIGYFPASILAVVIFCVIVYFL